MPPASTAVCDAKTGRAARRLADIRRRDPDSIHREEARVVGHRARRALKHPLADRPIRSHRSYFGRSVLAGARRIRRRSYNPRHGIVEPSGS